MRLRHLELTRYGRFTEQNFDFGDKPADGPDLHIVYGPNEAGKSTTLSAFLDLLFGIEARSRYNFLHAYPTMRIGATLEFADGAKQFTRLKRSQNSLLDANDQPVAESAILAELGDIRRDGYRSMFSLDDDTLEEGGESILASQGELGRLLFSAASGSAEISSRLLEARAETEAFYKYRARSGELHALKETLARLRTERDSIDTQAVEYSQLRAQREQSGRLYDEAVAERGRLQSRIDEGRRLLSLLPRMAQLRDMRGRMAPLAGLREPPDAWFSDLTVLMKKDIELAVTVRAAAASVDEIATALGSVAVDEAALALAPEVERLSAPEARFVTADKDLPERRLQLRTLDTTIHGLLARLGRPAEADPARLVLTAATIGPLRDLIESRSGIDAALVAAKREQQDARQVLEHAQADLARLVAGGDIATNALPELRAAMNAARAVDFSGRRQTAERSLFEERKDLDALMARLVPWSGSAAALAAMLPPDAVILARWKTAQDDLAARISRRQEDIERLTTETAILETELAAMAGAGGIVTDREAAETRQARDTAWAAHRRALDAATADAFEDTMRQDDLTGAGRLAHIGEVAGFTLKNQTLAAKKVELRRAGDLLDTARREQAALATEIAAANVALGLDPAFSVLQLETWLARRQAALDKSGKCDTAEREAAIAAADEDAVRKRLVAALAAAGSHVIPAGSLETLLAAIRDLVDREVACEAARKAVDQAARSLDTRMQAFAAAQAAAAEWDAEWQRICGACWLGEHGIPSVASVRETLDIAIELQGSLEKRATLADRVEKMEQDQAAFATAVAVLSSRLELADKDTDVFAIAQRIRARVADAIAGRNDRREGEERLAAAIAEQQRLEVEAGLQAVRKRERTDFFDVTTLDEVAECLRDVERRRELRDRIVSIEREVLQVLRLSDIGQAEERIDAVDPAALEQEIAELEPRLADIVRRCEELFAERSRAEDRLEAVGGDARAARLEEQRRTTILEIEDGAARYLRLRLGAAAAEIALRLYREQHRTAMMSKASEAFRIISRGAYTGLATQPDRDRETLIALSASGSKQVTDLSKGTRFQLYLALRVAGYHEFARKAAPVPFIADDIMETFDDFRAEEAFRLFADMARTGQVIYLTHHRHLCEIARAVCPEVRIHALDAGA
jgi:uncharacterized protein YhaN